MGFKICTIGCGEMAELGHGPSCKKYASENPEVELAACCDLDEHKASAFQKKFGFSRYYTDIDRMLGNEKPDAVSLIVPEQLTAQLSVKILEKKYPLLMEKPPGLNKEETLRMIEAAEKYKIPNQVAFNRRYIPLVRKLKELLSRNLKPDEIQNMSYSFYRVGRKDEDFAATAIHGIDTVKFLAGSDYKHIQFHYQQMPHISSNAANIYMNCVFESGATARIDFCPLAGVTVERAAINAFNQSYFLNIPIWNAMDSPGRLVYIEKSKVIIDVDGNEISDGSEMFETNGFYGENASFFDAVRYGQTPAGDIKSGLHSVEIADSIRKRAEEYKK